MLKAIHLFVSLSWPDKVSQNCFRFRTFHSSFFVATKWTEMRTVKSQGEGKNVAAYDWRTTLECSFQRPARINLFIYFPWCSLESSVKEKKGKARAYFYRSLFTCSVASLFLSTFSWSKRNEQIIGYGEINFRETELSVTNAFRHFFF